MFSYSSSGYNCRMYARLDTTNHTGYALTMGGGTAVVRLHKVVNGTLYQLGSDYSTGSINGSSFTLKLSIRSSGGVPTMTGYFGPTGGTISPIANLTATDNGTIGGSAITATGKAGIGFDIGLSTAPSDSQGIHADNLIASDPPAGPSITVTNPTTYQTFQRAGTGLASIPISGTYTGTPASIEASFNGGAYATIVASPTGGTFAGTLSGQSTGQGTLTVRFTDQTSISTTVSMVGIGDVFVMAGQSNMTGHGYDAQSYTTPGSGVKCTVYSKRGLWGLASADPYDVGSASSAPSAGNQSAWGSSTPSDSGTTAGAYALLVASKIAADQNVPIGLLPCAFSGAGLAHAASGYPLWAKGSTGLGSPAVSLYQGMLNQVANSGVNAVKAVLWHQGEADAKNGTTRRSTWLPCRRWPTTSRPTCPARPRPSSPRSARPTRRPPGRSTESGPRKAQAWAAGGNVLVGPTCYSTDLSTDMGSGAYYNASNDSLHFRTDQALADIASRWWAALKPVFYGGSDGRGPRALSASLDPTHTLIDVVFTDETLPLRHLDGDRVGDRLPRRGRRRPGQRRHRRAQSGANNVVRLTLPSSADTVTTVSLGYGNESCGHSVPVDSSANSLPAEPFYALPAPPPVVFRRTFSALGGKASQRQPVDA